MEQGIEFNQEQESRNAREITVKQIILSKLLDSVKQCQSEFGARNELATIENDKVKFLLLQLETVFVHGLKKNSAGIVQKLLLTESVNSSSTIWAMLKRTLLSDQDLQVYSKFNHVTTDTGRVRCWIRMTLNEKSLRRQLDSLISSSFLEEFYEQWAFITDTEMISAFSQMATGLQTILFALKTNDAELNVPPSLNIEEFLINYSSSDSILFSESSSNNRRIPRPILNLQKFSTGKTSNSSTPKLPTKQIVRIENGEDTTTKKSKKKLVNFVSFDSEKCFKDSACQMRVVLPDRSSSLSTPIMKNIPDNPFSDENSPEAENPLYLEKDESVLSDFTSGSTNNVFTIDSPDDSTSLGESCSASQITSETNESSLKVEFPKEDSFLIRKLSDEIDRLKFDLKSLKEDHERFIHMYELKLKTLKIQCESFKESKNLQNVPSNDVEQDDNVQNYSTNDTDLMAYEQKLIQLSQMHGELLELNDHLLKQDRQKSKLNERLRLELIALRGPLPEDMMRDYPLSPSSDANSFDIRPLVNIWIPTSFLTGKGADVHTIYQVYLRIADSEWNVYRRYSEFLNLHKYLIKKDPQVKTNFKFPPKKKFGSKKKNFVDTRRRDLEQYLRKVINYTVQNFPEFSSLSVTKETLSHLLPFFKP